MEHRPPVPHLRPRTVLVIALASTMLLAACFTLKKGETYAIGFERNRANLVVYTDATKVIYTIARDQGSATARRFLLDQAPSSIPISRAERLAICAVSIPLCLGADALGRVLLSWFRHDIRSRGDFWEAVSQAMHGRRCFAWTFLPRRNLTHKGIGTSGCRVAA